MNKNLRRSQGQVVLMVLLVSALVLTLGLSAARQATVETLIDTDQELLKRAFNAAESGIDYYLKTGNKELGNPDSFEGRSTLITEDLGNQSTLTNNKKVGPEEGEFFWLVDHNEDGYIGSDYYSVDDNKVDICVNETEVVDLKIDYFYKDGVDYKVVRGNGNIPVLKTSGGTNNCISEYDLVGQSVLLVVTPTSVDKQISIKGAYNFPVQGVKIKSTGIVGNVNNLVTIDRPYKLSFPFLLEPVVSESVVTN